MSQPLSQVSVLSSQEGDSQDPKAVIDDTVKVAEEFVKLYYKTLEARPHRVYQLYLESSVLIWDGNPLVGGSAMQKFFDDLPALTFNVMSMDCQRVGEVAIPQKSYIIVVTGTYRTQGKGTRGFIQNFVLTADGGKWKVASDTFRTQNSPNQEDTI